MKQVLCFLSVFTIAFSSLGKDCPTERAKGLWGTFHGTLLALDPGNQPTTRQNVSEKHVADGCDKFSFDIDYTDPTSGQVMRTVAFGAEWDETANLFTLKGDHFEGTLKILATGTYATSFQTWFGNDPAHCDETISITNQDTQLIRTVHCFAGNVGGRSLGVRVVQGSRFP
jgi:hypothetical protein